MNDVLDMNLEEDTIKLFQCNFQR